MDLARTLFGSTIGRKILMAVTGIILTLFVIGHLVGNLQVFGDPDHINGYAHFLQSLGPTLWVVRGVLLLSVGIHIWAAAVLTIESRQARGPEDYASKTWLQAAWASRYMRSSGVVVLAFIIYHIAHFTVGAAQPATFKENLPPYVMHGDYHVLGVTVVREGMLVLDVRNMVILGFQNRVVALFYILAVGLLSVHLLHGAESLFQTLGLRNGRWSRGLRGVVTVGCALYFLGNLAIPGAVLAGILKPEQEQIPIALQDDPASCPTGQACQTGQACPVSGQSGLATGGQPAGNQAGCPFVACAQGPSGSGAPAAATSASTATPSASTPSASTPSPGHGNP